MEEDIKILEGFIRSIRSDLEDESPDNWKLAQALENLIKGYRRLELENQALENTKNTCPNMATSGIRCDAKEKLKELEKHITFYEKHGSYKARIIELKEENEELKRLANNKQWISPCYVAQNYIPKSKVKEKIEKLNKEIDLVIDNSKGRIR